MADPSLGLLLARFEAAVLADSSILGVLYTGSLGRGSADRYSDLDIEVWLTDDAWTDLPTMTSTLLAVLGQVQVAEARDPAFTQANCRSGLAPCGPLPAPAERDGTSA